MIRKLLAAAAAAVALHGGALAQNTIKLGVVNIDTGPFAVSGAFVNDGAAFAVERLNAQGWSQGAVAFSPAGEEASGRYVCFMDHDDYLEPHALHRFADRHHDDPDVVALPQEAREREDKILFHRPRQPESMDNRTAGLQEALQDIKARSS